MIFRHFRGRIWHDFYSFWGLRFKTHFGAAWHRISEPFWLPNRAQDRPKIDPTTDSKLGCTLGSIFDGVGRASDGSGGPFGCHFGAVWWLFSSHFTTSPSSLYPAACFFHRSRYLLALSLLLPWRPRYSGSAGARCSAYNFTINSKNHKVCS